MIASVTGEPAVDGPAGAADLIPALGSARSGIATTDRTLSTLAKPTLKVGFFMLDWLHRRSLAPTGPPNASHHGFRLAETYATAPLASLVPSRQPALHAAGAIALVTTGLRGNQLTGHAFNVGAPRSSAEAGAALRLAPIQMSRSRRFWSSSRSASSVQPRSLRIWLRALSAAFLASYRRASRGTEGKHAELIRFTGSTASTALDAIASINRRMRIVPLRQA